MTHATPDNCPLNLGELLRLLALCGELRHLSLVETSDGDWQASHRSPEGGYKVFIASDPVVAFMGALTPPYGYSWDWILGDPKDDVEVEDLL